MQFTKHTYLAGVEAGQVVKVSLMVCKIAAAAALNSELMHARATFLPLLAPPAGTSGIDVVHEVRLRDDELLTSPGGQ